MRYEIDKASKAHEKKVIITFYDDKGNIKNVKDMCVIDNKAIYEEIAKGKMVSLFSDFIDNFSMMDCRQYIEEHYPEVDISNMQLKIDAEQAFFNNANFFYAIFSPETDFLRATFSGGASFCGATFSGGASFSEATFSGEAVFRGATFSGKANFFRATFSGGAFFNEATLSGEAVFSGATFSGEAGFYGATFSEEASFFEATFSGGAFFSEAIFSGGASFSGATFSGGAGFYGATFSGGARFRIATFLGGASFYLATFSGEVDYSHAEFFKSLGFNVKYCKYIHLRDSSIGKHLKLGGDIIVLNLLDADINGKIVLQAAKAKEMIYSQDNTNYYEKAEQFILLKENFNKQGKYEDEDEIYVEFKKCEAKAKLDEAKGEKIIKRAYRYTAYGLRWFVFDFVGKYGTSYKDVLESMVVTILLFSNLYLLFGLNVHTLGFIKENPTILNKFIGYIYYSGITFFTVGYGEITPNTGALAVLAVVQSFLGVFLMSYFVVAFARKAIR